MSDRINETDIRARLERYYSGESDNAEVRGLVEALEKLQPLPPDLGMELDLLRLMLRDAELKDEAIEIPAALEVRLRADIHRYAAADRKKMLRRRIAGWSVAAAVALLTTVSVGYMSKLPVDLSEKGGMASVGSDSLRIAQMTTDSGIVSTAAVDTATASALVLESSAQAEKVKPAKTASGKSVAKKIVTPAKYSRQAGTQNDAKLLGLAMQQVRNDAKDVGRALAEDLKSTMQESRLSLASTINESRIADMELVDYSHYDSDEAIPMP